MQNDDDRKLAEEMARVFYDFRETPDGHAIENFLRCLPKMRALFGQPSPAAGLSEAEVEKAAKAAYSRDSRGGKSWESVNAAVRETWIDEQRAAFAAIGLIATASESPGQRFAKRLFAQGPKLKAFGLTELEMTLDESEWDDATAHEYDSATVKAREAMRRFINCKDFIKNQFDDEFLAAMADLEVRDAGK